MYSVTLEPEPETALAFGVSGSVLLTVPSQVWLPACWNHCDSAYAAALLSVRPTSFMGWPLGSGGWSLLQRSMCFHVQAGIDEDVRHQS